MQQDGSNEDIKGSSPKEWEEKRGVTVYIVGDMWKEFQASDNKTKNDDVHPDNDRARWRREKLADTTQYHDDTDGDINQAKNVREVHLAVILFSTSCPPFNYSAKQANIRARPALLFLFPNSRQKNKGYDRS